MFSPDLLKPCESLSQCRDTLAGIVKESEADPENSDNEGLEYFFDTEVKRLEKNKSFVESTRKAVTSGEGKFVQHIVVTVEDIDSAVDFWTKGMGMQVIRERSGEGLRTVFVAYGPETFKAETGGNFALELVESPAASPRSWVSPGGQLEYIQVAVGNVRLGALVESGAKVLYSYGYLELLAPGGLLVKQRVGVRRDPVELLAFKVKNIDAAVEYYEQALGMQVVERTPPLICTQEKKGGILGALGFADKTCNTPKFYPFAPSTPPGSVRLCYGESKDTVNILLIPQEENVSQKSGTIYQKLAILTNNTEKSAQNANTGGAEVAFVGAVPGIGTKVGALRDPNSYVLVFVDYEDFEKEQP
eukprot:CAMPEP_0196583828 /NCGR_PEP_ID=MMETSP1081-20130531/44847_1 /TAXON_ID=36882 /ORGANISM="Pyramimonas amylifera, Strain CCMP720" /LENGTH=359 /DNA_ID=CAMNT_0041904845 /DNA_START=305 /DNA_END=1384 /DNA_ORIENTATION=-